MQGGEELRIDQRVQQLFNVMNGLLSHSVTGNTKNPAVCTYDVIPMSPTLGLLAFVDGTRPLENVMVPLTVSESSYRKASETYQRHVEKGMGGYNAIFKKPDHKSVVLNFEKAESLIRWDGLREAFVRYAGNGTTEQNCSCYREAR